jgi:hypothetical protein
MLRTPDSSEFDRAQTKLLQEAPCEVAHVEIPRIYCNRFNWRFRCPQLLCRDTKPFFLHVLLNSNPRARFEKAARLAARDAQPKLSANIVKVPANLRRIAVDQISEFQYTPIVSNETNPRINFSR